MSPEPETTASGTRTDTPPRESAPHTGTTRARLRRGIQLGMPVFLGYVPVGMAFGILARTLGFSVFQACLCSGTALAGAGQFIALSFLRTGAPLASTLVATAVVNLRYVLFGSTLSPYLKGTRLPALAWLSFTLTDETFAINIADRRKGTSSAASMAGVGLISWIGWVSGTLVGAVGATWIGDPSKWGVDFAMPAMFAALFVALAENRKQVVTGIGAAVITMALPALSQVGIKIPSTWFIVIASMVAATLASVVFESA